MKVAQTPESDDARVGIALLKGYKERLDLCRQEKGVSVGMLIECLIEGLSDDQIRGLVSENLDNVKARRTEARLARLRAKREAQTDLASRVGSMSAAELAELERMISQVSAGKPQ